MRYVSVTENGVITAESLGTEVTFSLGDAVSLLDDAEDNDYDLNFKGANTATLSAVVDKALNDLHSIRSENRYKVNNYIREY